MDRKYLEVFNTFGGYSYDEWNKCEFLNVVFYTLKKYQKYQKVRKYESVKLPKNQEHFGLSVKIPIFLNKIYFF